MSAWRSSPTGKRREGRRAWKCGTPESRPGDWLCVWEPGGASLLIAHSPGTALSQSLCRLLLPLQLRGGDEAPVIHSLDRQLAPSGPLPLSQGADWPASSSLLWSWPQTQTASSVPGSAGARGPCRQRPLPPFLSCPTLASSLKGLGGLRKQRGSCLISKI